MVSGNNVFFCYISQIWFIIFYIGSKFTIFTVVVSKLIYSYCRERSERPYMKEHSDTIVPHSFVNKNSGSNFVQNWSKFSDQFQESLFIWFLAKNTLNFCLIYIILDSLKAELSDLNNHISKSYVSSIWVALC